LLTTTPLPQPTPLLFPVPNHDRRRRHYRCSSLPPQSLPGHLTSTDDNHPLYRGGRLLSLSSLSPP
jgi:hypothetical protein